VPIPADNHWRLLTEISHGLFEWEEIALNALELKLSDAVTLAVPASLQSITTYVLLEQERWFEKEMNFFFAIGFVRE
jgi:hypothetical protein